MVQLWAPVERPPKTPWSSPRPQGTLEFPSLGQGWGQWGPQRWCGEIRPETSLFKNTPILIFLFPNATYTTKRVRNVPVPQQRRRRALAPGHPAGWSGRTPAPRAPPAGQPWQLSLTVPVVTACVDVSPRRPCEAGEVRPGLPTGGPARGHVHHAGSLLKKPEVTRRTSHTEL